MTSDKPKGTYSKGDALAIYKQIKQTGDFLGFAEQFLNDQDSQATRNALWGLSKATAKELSQLQPILHELIDLALSTKKPSILRLSLTIIERLNMKSDDLRTDFLDFCLEHMVCVEESPAIQSLCMKLAFKMSRFYTALMDEFMRTIETMEIEYYKPAVKSVARRIIAGKMK